MKTLLRTLTGALAIFCGTGSFAQQAIPNNGFETWTQRGRAEAPQSWLTFDDAAVEQLGQPLPFSTNTTVKSTDRRGGNFAARLQSQRAPVGSTVFPGLLVLGSRVNVTADVESFGGIPYTSRPASLQFYYKLTGAAAATDPAAVLVLLNKTVNGSSEIVAGAAQLLAPQAEYTLLNLPLEYDRNETPDTLRIIFLSSLEEVPTVGTELFIDDVTLTGTVAAAKNPALEAALTVYPNPSPNGEFSLASPGNSGVATAPYTITDAAGHVVRTAAAAPASMANGRPLELRGLPAGVYLLQLRTPEGPLTRKLMIP